ncbi:MAG: methylamine utilization protein [Usitatibacteraceae bacterium]
MAPQRRGANCFTARLLCAFFCALAVPVAAASLSVTVADKAGAPVADAAVYAEPVGAKPTLKPSRAQIDQVNKEFDPLVSVMQVGTSVSFPNHDNIRHQVYSFSPAKVFQLKLYSGQPSQPVTFDKPGVIALGCNIHDWMLSYVVVVDTPYYGKTDATGKVKLDGLPAGDYDVKLWHYRASTVAEISAERRLALGKDAATMAFTIELKSKAHVPGPVAK